MKLSIIILNFNVCYFLELCLQSVVAAIDNIDAEIIVVDNNSSDNSCKMVKQRFPNVVLIQNKENTGFSKGNNIGVSRAKGEYLCILNPDTVVGEDTFKRVLKFAESKNDMGIAGCQLIDGSGNFLPESKRQIPTPKIAFEKLMGKTKNYYTNALDKDETGKTDILVGAFMVMKREVYSQIQGFDEDYFMYGEDIDLSYKVLKAGYTNYYYGETAVIHYKGESTFKDKIYTQRFYGAMEIFYKKHFKRSSFFNAIVRLGVKIASRKQVLHKDLKANFESTIIVSNKKIEELYSHLKQPITSTSNLDEINKHSQVLLDATFLSYREIIDFMKNNHSSKGNSYRILPKNSNFIVGSDSSESRGEVLCF